MSFYNIDIEKALLASLMSIEKSFEIVASKIDANDFAANKHELIFQAVKALDKDGLPYDTVMVHDWLASNNYGIDVPDSYLAEVLSTSPATLFNLKAYADRILELSKYRAVNRVLLQAQDELRQADTRLDDKVNGIIEQLTTVIDTNKSGSGARSVGSLMEGFFNNLQAASKGEVRPFSPTGFDELDNRSPIQNGDLVVVGARPSMGKTTFGQNIVQSMVKDSFYTDSKGEHKHKAGVFFSLEMTEASVMQRFMSSMAGVDLGVIRSGMNVSTDDWANLNNTVRDYSKEYPMFIESRSLITYHQMRTTLNRIRNQYGEIGVIMIDYLQIMGGIDGKDRVNALGEVTRHLKAFGKEFNCPVLLLSQLNRSLESRPDKRPIMSDLRESGAIEQEADVIMFLYRDEVYNEKSKDRGIAEVIIAKNRQGQVGTVRLGFEGRYSRFTNYSPMTSDLDAIPDFRSNS
ncbi:replicative DNA helicase [uncultured Psychrobacter sp.]|uniref:replicative DNA helicase n=1 Tax=uncultured Psychrobacter sp. TaxID=259303 RepID=UPI002636EC74|nr:replicative DNA helicase [uncultured Psychrobacter sp.]